LVKTIDLGSKKAGAYVTKDKSAYWDGVNDNGEKVSSGIYFYNFRAGNYNIIKKITVIR
jgi:flagellar hook assembly protein FlgD